MGGAPSQPAQEQPSNASDKKKDASQSHLIERQQVDRTELLGALSVLPDEVLLSVFAFLDLKTTMKLSAMNSALHSLVSTDYHWRAMTASMFGEPPLDCQPQSWLAFFKLRYGPGRPEYTFKFLVTLFTAANRVAGEAGFLKIYGAIRWTLTSVPEGAPGNWLRHRLWHVAHEYVVGYYCPDDGMVRFAGVDMDEGGHGLIALDRYELRLSYNGQLLAGVTRGNDEDDLNWLNPFEGQLAIEDKSDDGEAKGVKSSHNWASYRAFVRAPFNYYNNLLSLVRGPGDRQTIHLGAEATFSVTVTGAASAQARVPVAWTCPSQGDQAIITFANAARVATAPLVYAATRIGTFTQQAAIVVWSSALQEQLERGARPDLVRCTVEQLRVWGATVRFSYAVKNT